MYGVKSKLGITETFQSSGEGTRCVLTIKNAAGSINTYQSLPEFGSKDAAKQDAVQIALTDLIRGDPSAAQLLSLLPKGELTNSRNEILPTFSSSLLSPQRRGSPFITKEGSTLKESRSLEFKALEPGTEKDTPSNDLERIIERYLRPTKDSLGFYISAFLNSRINGNIVFGVRDDGIVWGLPITTNGEDKFLLAFDDMLRRFYPILSLDKGLIKKPVFIPVITVEPAVVVKDLKIIIIEGNAPPLSQGDVIFFWDAKTLPAIKWEASATLMTPEELLRKVRP